MFNRRQFLKSAGALTLFPVVNRLPSAFAATAVESHFFVLFRASLGMDATLGLDPWLGEARPLETDMFVEYNKADLFPITNQLTLGPALAPMVKHAGQFSVVNGVFMSQSDNGHFAPFNYRSAATA